MSYYDNQKDYEARGIDYDLDACLRYNGQPFKVDQIERVLAVWEGQNDGDDWRWVIQLKLDPEYGETRYVFLQGGCDYTGWDCQSYAHSQFAPTAMDAVKFAATGEAAAQIGDTQSGMGLGQLLNVLGGSYMKNAGEVYDDLVKQLEAGKDKTWRENKDQEFGIVPPIDHGDY